MSSRSSLFFFANGKLGFAPDEITFSVERRDGTTAITFNPEFAIGCEFVSGSDAGKHPLAVRYLTGREFLSGMVFHFKYADALVIFGVAPTRFN